MKMRNKVFAINFTITIIVVLLIAIFIVVVVDDYNLNTVYQYLLSQSDFSQTYVTQYLSGTDLRHHNLILLNHKGTIEERLAKQVGCPVTIKGNWGQDLRLEQQSALKGKKAYFVETTQQKRVFHFAFPLISEGIIVGIASYHYSLYEIDRMRGQLILVLGIATFFSSLIVFLLSYGLSFRIIKPLERLINLTRDYSAGNFRKKEEIRTGDEIEELAVAFEKMGSDIEGIIVNLKEEQAKQKRFMDNVTHEIRTPLTNIMGYADLLPRINDEEQKSKYLLNIQSEGKRLLEMVESLLELSRLKQYSFSLEKKEENLKDLIEKVIDLMIPRIKKMGFSLDCDLQSIKANVDEEKVKQVIINILDNAIKYSEGNMINMRLWEDEKINIQILDNGKGIPCQDVENLTQPFFRVDKSRSKKMGGVGLGLSICKEIIENHGGTLKIESEINKGTIVTISLQP